ncbi:MAG: type II secretion system protein [Gallionella sp.]|nr:type II secretion system protein [Gallionella sp.]
MRTSTSPKILKGFSLVELIMVIVITGILGSMVAVFLKAPIQQYMDVSRRAELTDVADTALYRMASEISTAVPNSIRPQGSGLTYVEFLPTKNGGRYRASADLSGASAVGDILDFTANDGSFDLLGPSVDLAQGDGIVVGSVQSDGNPPYDQSAASGVLRTVPVAAAGTTVANITATRFPAFAQLPSQRFDVVPATQQAVTYACEGALGALDANQNGQAQLVKHWAYGFNAVQVAPAGLGGTSAILADNVSACSFDYDVSNQRLGLLGIRLTLTSGGESVSLYHEIHVNNIP